MLYFKLFSLACSIWPIKRTLSCETTPGQSGPGSDVNERSVPHSPKLQHTGTSPSDCQIQDTFGGSVIPLQICSQCILQPQPTGQGTTTVLLQRIIWALNNPLRLICHWAIKHKSNSNNLINHIVSSRFFARTPSRILRILFVDFTKAFDPIHSGKMEEIQLAYGLPKDNHSSINDSLQKHQSESAFTGWRHRILWHCRRSTTRRHASQKHTSLSSV